MNSLVAPPLTRARNAFGICAKRFSDFGKPGCRLWTEAGERAVDEAKAGVQNVRNTALTAELEDRAAVEIIDRVLQDGRVDQGEIRELKAARQRIAKSAKADATIGGVEL